MIYVNRIWKDEREVTAPQWSLPYLEYGENSEPWLFQDSRKRKIDMITYSDILSFIAAVPHSEELSVAIPLAKDLESEDDNCEST